MNTAQRFNAEPVMQPPSSYLFSDAEPLEDDIYPDDDQYEDVDEDDFDEDVDEDELELDDEDYSDDLDDDELEAIEDDLIEDELTYDDREEL